MMKKTSGCLIKEKQSKEKTKKNYFSMLNMQNPPPKKRLSELKKLESESSKKTEE